ncbi:hypothetical protein MIND_00085000 [Mycena indigotica]|uniref:Uncharacterized protein n=1 Tax=Mycena indigotica TaxID=2126181 RepID=A0A8H6TEA3_9AGAR|nr:uncharacterized protein MIND_00085000 [Mycena indigotica]KAF7315694.1 hypothetical protein MIND_00085000 [Mycena indigotica]
MAVVQFNVNDTSPTFSFFPRADTFSPPNISAGWEPFWTQPGFSASPETIGSGQSSHITSLDGASFILHWKGTGIQLFGNVTRSSFSISIDGQPTHSPTADLDSNLLFNLQNLPNLPHTLSFVVQATGQVPIVQLISAVISAPPSPANISIANFTEVVLNETAWSYQGRWSFLNDSDSSQRSATAGDKATLHFQGTSFLLRGSTSPDAGNYSVTLDNVTTTYNARSSFAQSDSLLFFASGLDANTLHHVEIDNTEGATLILPIRGASVFSLPDNATNSTSGTSAAASAAVSPSNGGGLSSGTIAALVLAGVLIFFIVVCVLVYFLVYRPYKRRQRLLQQPQKEEDLQDTGSVLVVDIAPDAVTKSYYDHHSGPSQAPANQRSGFARWKEEVEGGRLGSWSRGALGIAFRHSDSSGRRGTSGSSVEYYDLDGSSNGYKSSSSEGYTNQRKGKGKERGSRWSLKGKREKSASPQFKLEFPIDDPPPAAGSHLTVPTEISSLSYMSSPSIHPTTIPSEPPTPPPFPNTHSRVNSNNPLLVSEDPTPTSRPRLDDRGSVREYDAVDDGQSIIGDGAVRIALRSLSPRTSENEQSPRQSTKRRKEKRVKREKTPSPLAADAGGLTLRATSPFQVDFNGARLSGQSRVRFEGDSGGKAKPPKSSGHLKDISFLDFTSSSEASVMTRSRDYSVSSHSFGPQSHWSAEANSSNERKSRSNSSNLPLGEPKSRWSATTAPSSDAHHQDASNGSSDSNFPFPVSLPTSPHHPAGTFIPPSHHPAESTMSSLNSHPLSDDNLTSPTDSYPLSVSDIHFRHSDSEEPSTSRATSGIPGHPPLPSAPPEEEEQQQSYIVQRVAGISTPSPSIGTTMLATTPTPTATRFTSSPGTRPAGHTTR